MFDLITQRYIQMAFAFVMVLWSAFYTAYFTQQCNLKCQQWGMMNFGRVAQERKQFKKEKRGTWFETIQNQSHWWLAVVMMVQTVGAVACISEFRGKALEAEREDKMIHGMSGKYANHLGKTLITVNIKVVDAFWKAVSPMLSANENWRTSQEAKDAMVSKLFVVKFVIYYYPFFYLAFMKEHIEGCGGSPTGCIDELVENLKIFFITHIVTTAINIAVPIVMTYVAIKGEQSKAKEGHAYTYIQAQGKCPEYPGDTDDFMELILSLGFLMMFSVVLPVMAFLSLLSNLVELRLLGFRMINVSRRAPPTGQEGIGAWASIIKVVSIVGVMVNAGMAVFAMHPLKDLPLKQKVAIFLAVENILLLLVGMIWSSIPPKSLAHEEAEARDNSMLDEIMGDSSKPVTGLPVSPAVKLPMEIL